MSRPHQFIMQTRMNDGAYRAAAKPDRHRIQRPQQGTANKVSMRRICCDQMLGRQDGAVKRATMPAIAHGA